MRCTMPIVGSFGAFTISCGAVSYTHLDVYKRQAQYAADVLAVADALGSRSFVVVGHSMGGQIAQWISATANDRVIGQVLLCPVPASGIPLPADAQALFRNSAQNRSMQQTILGLACKQLDDAARERLLDDAGGVSPQCVEQAFDTWTAGGFSDRLSDICCLLYTSRCV